jgi:hypothetical protein
MTKDHILSEIRRTTAQNGGVPLGQQRFAAETGIGHHDWYGRFWTKWSDALREAGYAPNRFGTAVPEDQMIEHLAALTRELGHYPVEADIRMKARTVPNFPSHSTFNRLGGKADLIAKVHAFALARGYSDVVSICAPHLETVEPRGAADEEVSKSKSAVGYVYLFRHGTRREFKIGRTNNTVRREGEIGVELPQEIEPIHVIETDDPAGVESYWHRRFAKKRLRNEWFALTPDDVSAFRRWRKIC